MICHVAGCDGHAKRVGRIRVKCFPSKAISPVNVFIVHACADHWPKVGK